MSTVYIWWCKFFAITIYKGQNVQVVLNFHAVLSALHQVAPGSKKESRLDLRNPSGPHSHLLL